MAKGLKITAKVDGFRRGGIAHPSSPTIHRADAFTEDQLKQLCEEPGLVVEEVDIPNDKPPAGNQAKAGQQTPAK